MRLPLALVLLGLALQGCASQLVSATRAGRLADACEVLARQHERGLVDEEGEAELGAALAARGQLRWRATVLTPTELSQWTEAPPVEGVFGVRTQLTLEAPSAPGVRARVRGASLGAASLDWAGNEQLLLPLVLCPTRAPPVTPAYVKRPYTPTPRPEVPTRTVRRSAAARLLGGLAEVATLGVVKSADEVEVPTRAGEAALRAWAEANRPLREAWDAAEQQCFDDTERLRAPELARAAQWPDRCRAAVAARTRLSCTSGSAGMMAPGDRCEWVALVRAPSSQAASLEVSWSWVLETGCEVATSGTTTLELRADGPRDAEGG